MPPLPKQRRHFIRAESLPNGDVHESGAIIAKAFRRAKLFTVRWTDVTPRLVDAYSGYKANERPCQFTLDEVVYEIAAVLDQWYEPSATYFKVQSTERKIYLLQYDEDADEWTLQSGFDGDELLARPS